MKPYAKNLIISPEQAAELFPNTQDRAKHAPRYRNGRDIAQSPRNAHVIDFFGVPVEEILKRFPEAYQYLFLHVRPERSQTRNPRLREEWWLFEANRPELRMALKGLSRYTEQHKKITEIEKGEIEQ